MPAARRSGVPAASLLLLGVRPLTAGPPQALLQHISLEQAVAATEAAGDQLRDLAASFCSDTMPDCSAWAAMGECVRNQGFMLTSCRQSCNACVASGMDLQNYAEAGLIAVRNAQLARELARAPPSEPLAVWELKLQHPDADLTSRLLALATDVEEALGDLPAPGPGGAPYQLPHSNAEPANVSTARVRLFLQPGDAASAASAGQAELGPEMPVVGFGTWMLPGRAAYDAVRLALAAGFRHIDTSENYGNEAEVGRAIADSGVARDEIFLATKLSNPDSYGAGARAVLERQLRDLGTAYVDLYMLHGAHPSPAVMKETWQSLEQAHAAGLALALGVSNFLPHDLDALAQHARTLPAVVQNKHSVYRPGTSLNYAADDVLKDVARRGIVFTGYCVINAWPAVASALRDVHVAAIAAAHGRSPAQVLLRWAVQSGVTVLTRTTSSLRAAENAAVFDFVLSSEEMATLGALHWLAHAPWNRLPVAAEAQSVSSSAPATQEKKMEL